MGCVYRVFHRVSSLEVKCQRWLLSWPGRPELVGEAFLTRCYDEYVQTAQATFSQIMANLGLDDDEEDEEDEEEEEEENDTAAKGQADITMDQGADVTTAP